jgi:hypothetical protein
VPDQICGGAQTGFSTSKLEPSAKFAGGVKYLYLSEGQFIGPPVIRARLIVDDLRAVYGISAGTGASSSAGVRKNVETTERAFVVLLYLCGPKAIG